MKSRVKKILKFAYLYIKVYSTFFEEFCWHCSLLFSQKNSSSPIIHLIIRSRIGSVQHYYHFLLGFLLPLAEWYGKQSKLPNFIQVRSCALMDPLLLEVGFESLNIIQKDQLMKKHCSHRSFNKPSCKIFGFDYPEVYESDRLENSVKHLKSLLKDKIEECHREIYVNYDQVRTVIMINRLAPHTFYSTSESEIQGAGSSRRSVPNYNELVHAVTENGFNVINCSLEGKSLAWQIALFESARIIIAQHGASLANLVFSKPGTSVLEIFPETLMSEWMSSKYFSNLSHRIGLHHNFVYQSGPHDAVDPSILLKYLNKVVLLQQTDL
jgi:hypothetical protein